MALHCSGASAFWGAADWPTFGSRRSNIFHNTYITGDSCVFPKCEELHKDIGEHGWVFGQLMNPPRRGTWRSQVKDVYSRVFRDKKSLQVTCVQFNAAEADGAAHDSRQRQDSQQDGPPVSLRRINRNMISNKMEALVSFGLRLRLRSLE